MKTIVAMLVLLLGLGTAAAEDRCPTPAISLNIETPIPLSPPARAWLEAQLRQATAKVWAWWGPSFTGVFTIDVVEADGPSMALILAWRGERGRVMFPASLVRRGRAATIHEIVHVYAPNANRFLAEGLAVYAHEKLGGPIAFPNVGASLHTAAAAYAQADVTALECLATPSRLELDRLADREAYLVAGSFAISDRAARVGYVSAPLRHDTACAGPAQCRHFHPLAGNLWPQRRSARTDVAQFARPLALGSCSTRHRKLDRE